MDGEAPLSEQTFTDFVQAVASGQLKPILKTEQVPAAANPEAAAKSAVTKIVGANFEEIVL